MSTKVDVMERRLSVPSRGTVKRKLKRIGSVRISAEPRKKDTVYDITFEKPVLTEVFAKAADEKFTPTEKKIFGEVVDVRVITSDRLMMIIPSTDPKLCTQYLTSFLKWIDSAEYSSSLERHAKEFEGPILQE